MHIVIMGCGRVGSSLAILLEKRGHDVSVIDIDDNSFRRLGPDFKGRTVKGVGFDRSVLEKAGIREADGFAAVSSGDNSNVLSARVVREEFGIDNVVARIYDQGRAEVYERLGIPIRPGPFDPCQHPYRLGRNEDLCYSRSHPYPAAISLEVRSGHGPQRSHLAAGWRRRVCSGRGGAHHRNRGPAGQATGQTLIVTDNAVHPGQGES